MALLEAVPGRITVNGPLTFATARQAREAGLDAIASANAGELQVDCAAVRESDSAGLVVLLDWLATARRRGITLRFMNLPSRLLAIAQISEIEGMLAAHGAVPS